LLKRIITSLLSAIVICYAIIDISAFNVSARSAVLIEAESGNTIYENNAHQRLPMASTTKIMTAIVAIERCDVNEIITVTENMTGAEGSSVYLKAGEKLSLKQLLYALMLESANDAAEAIAISVSGSVENFAALMNQKAAELHLENTNFTNPHGLDDDEHYTTASDLAKITAYALENSVFSEIVSTNEFIIPETEHNSVRYLRNHNKMLRIYDGTIGVKTGFTKRCGRCLVTAAEKDGVKLIAVTLSAPDDWNDHITMLDYGFEQLESVDIAAVGSLCFTMPVACGEADSVTISNKDSLSLTLKKGHSKIECKVYSESGKFLYAPINKGDHIADAVFYSDETEIARIPLFSTQTVTGCDVDKGFFDFLN